MRTSVIFRKSAQFSFRHSEFGGATFQTDYKLGEYPYDGLVKVIRSWKMDGYLCSELALLF